MPQEKICPIMTQGFLIAFYGKSPRSSLDMQVNDISLRKHLPKCLKRDCGLWVNLPLACSPHGGHCGFISRK